VLAVLGGRGARLPPPGPGLSFTGPAAFQLAAKGLVCPIGVRHTRLMAAIKISVQAEPRDIDSWSSLTRRLESSGFEALVMGDHPGAGASPWPALGAAAAVTATLKLGTYVLQCGVREPVQAAADAATLDILAPGRVLFGLGAGHTFREWEATGRSRPAPADRVGRLGEFVDAVARLLDGRKTFPPPGGFGS